MNSRTPQNAPGSEPDLEALAGELEAELERLRIRLEALEANEADASMTGAALPKPTVTAPVARLHRVEVIAVESGPVVGAAAPLPPTVRLRVRKTERRRSRRRGRMSFAARVITGSCLAVALCIQPASSVSLWNQAQAPGLYAPVQQTWKVGAIVTVFIDEATSADHQWTAERQKELTIDGGAAAAGAGAGRVNLLGLFFPFMNANYQSEVKSDNTSDRRVSLRATLSAEVVNVLPNGNLQILAKKVTRVNSEEQTIELTGNIRPEDISPSNTVSSAALADAQIKVNGTLRYTNDAKPGILERIASFLSGLFL